LIHAEARFTDDTVCTVAVADALVDDRHPGHALKHWGRRYWENGGWSGMLAKWLKPDSLEPYFSYDLDRTPDEHYDPISDEGDTLRWLDDDELAEHLQLEPEQRTSLLEAREALYQARLEGREQMEMQRDLEMEAAGDADRLAEQREQSGLIEQELDEAEMRWQEDVRTALSPEQLRQLEELIER
jgi:hypothetical protein